MKTPDRARTNGLKGLKTVEKILSSIGWEPQATATEGVLRVDFAVDNIPIAEAVADVRIDFERFLYYLLFRDRAPKKHMQQTMEFITRANFDLVAGNFELDLSDGTVRFKSSIDFTRVTLSQTLIQNAIRSAMDCVEQYADALVGVMCGDKTAIQAIKEAEDSSS